MPTGDHEREFSSLLAIAAAECKLRLSAHTGRLCAPPASAFEGAEFGHRVADGECGTNGASRTAQTALDRVVSHAEVGHRGSSRWGGRNGTLRTAVTRRAAEHYPHALYRTVAAVSSPEVLGSGPTGSPRLSGGSRAPSELAESGAGGCDTRRRSPTPGERAGGVAACRQLPRVKRRAVRAAHRQRRAETAPLLQGGVPARERRGTLRCRHGRVRLVTVARGSTSVTPAGAVVFDMRS